jgi:hypothetical protein
VFTGLFNGGDVKTLPIPATSVIDRHSKAAWGNADFDYTRLSEAINVITAIHGLP